MAVNHAYIRLAAVLASALGVLRAAAQCEPQWLYHPAQAYPGVNGEVRAITMWDPDGPGPMPDKPLFAGNFTIAGDKPCSNMAWWDGQEWQAFGTAEVENPYYVYSMIIRGGDLHIGGSFATLQGQTLNNVARWDGAAWQPLAEGVKGEVNALLEWNSQLIAGGIFTKAGTKEAHSVARWNGTEWSPIGWGMDGPVHSLCVHNGELYAGGQFEGADFTLCNNIARWDGLQWRRLGPLLSAGVSGPVYALESFEDTLVIGGKFSKAAGLPASNLARWDGTAITPFPATFAPTQYGSGPDIRSIRTWNDALYVSGRFGAVDEILTGTVARWAKGRWSPLSDSVVNYEVNAMDVDPTTGHLVFRSTVFLPLENRDTEAQVVGFDGQQFVSYGRGRMWDVNEMISYQGRLVASSFFSDLPGQPYLAEWDGLAWSSLGQSPDDYNLTMIEHEGALVVGGSFKEAGGQDVNNVAAWDGESWFALGNGIPGGKGSGIYRFESHKGDLIASGKYLVDDGAPGNSIARWTGTDWKPLGGGLTKGVSYTHAHAMASLKDELFVVGSFTDAGGVPVKNAARWNGTVWSSIPTTLGTAQIDYFADLVVWNGTLYASGDHLSPTLTPFVASWNGGQWVLLRKADPGGQLAPLKIYRDELYAGAYNIKINGQLRHGIVRWDGTEFVDLGKGLVKQPGLLTWVSCLAVHQDELVVGGPFLTAGGGISTHWARYGCPPPPPCPADCDQNAQLNINDFGCFQTNFAIGDPKADCDGDGQLLIDDFICFQTLFALGC